MHTRDVHDGRGAFPGRVTNARAYALLAGLRLPKSGELKRLVHWARHLHRECAWLLLTSMITGDTRDVKPKMREI